MIAVLMLSLFLTAMFAGCVGSKEHRAKELFDSGNYLAAAEIYAELGDKKMQAESLYEAGHYGEAKDIFSEINDLAGVSKCLTGLRGALNKIKPAN